MKKQFKEHYQYSEDELKRLWDEAYFVFDTNTLLNMYRYNRDTFKEYLKVLKELAKRKKLFLPHQVGEEFFRNRMNVIQEYKKSYDELLKITSAFKGQLSSKYRHHPFIDIQNLSETIDKALDPTETEIKEKQAKHPDWILRDEILKDLTEVFNDCTGDTFTDQEKDKIFKEGEVRYDKKIPPGFKDAEKGGERQYGDLIVWKQMLTFAKENKRPVIFITADEKEDWWLLYEGKRLMPLPSLKREMRLEAGVDFHAYTADRFLETYNERNSSRTIDTKAIDEVRKLREIQDRMTPEVFLYRKRAGLDGDLDEKYELFVITISKFFEIIEHLQELLPNELGDAIAQLEHINDLMGVISRRVRTSGKVNNFYLRKAASFLDRVDFILSNQSDTIDDSAISKQIDKYQVEINNMRHLLERGEHIL